jgi:transcriptional regulator with XRE-family HTH domain
MAHKQTPNARQRMRNVETIAFLESLNGGRLTFAQLLSACRRSRAESAAVFAARLGVSRQHLHQLETGNKGVSPERAVRFARCLGQSETYFLQLALQDLANESGVSRKVEVRVA